ncbi:hypothetical protein [Prosthecobacter vanneervenii]|uniref:Uncharacterized protein n=1 Tax=Prosthecobacter vanneervenii TaxID=48466 RepID=A0A7W7YCP0_9BACT|nr:hypothetical protein [Prosthecobacter vanneervenii]MBB5033715.1 hypothetical protein [Prosthecobacter vanneervenii]
METTLQQILYVAAAVVFAMGCRSYDNRFIQKLGWLALLGASYLGGYFLTNTHVGGAIFVGAWFMLPWMEIVFRVRRLRFPIKSEVKHRFPPSREVFPELSDLSSEADNEGFVEVGDTGWQFSQTDYFMRLFYHEAKRTQASIALVQQGDFGFPYVSLTSRASSGVTFTTTNYPFAATMKHSPKQRLNRFMHAGSFAELMDRHEHFLQSEGIRVEDLSLQDTEYLHAYIERDMSMQIDHNITAGVIEPTGNGEFRYSWRGCIFLYWQVVKDMLRV